MPKKVRRVLGRPKTGQKFYTRSFSLTLAEIEFINNQTNPSALVRNLIEEEMIKRQLLESGIEDDLEAIRVNRQIERLRKESDEAYEEWMNFWHKIHITGCTKEGYVRDEETGERVLAVGANDEEKAELRVLRALAARVERLDAQVEELQKKLASMSNKRKEH
jgi:hypothetical protein